MRTGNSHRTDQCGFTLIELVITTLVVGIIAYVVAVALSTGTKAYFTTDFREEALGQANLAMERMTREIRNLKDSVSVSLAPPATTLQFKFTDANNNSVDFVCDIPNIKRNGIVLASNITACTFGYVRINGTVEANYSAANTKRIRINITAQIRTESVTLQSEIWPRSL